MRVPKETPDFCVFCLIMVVIFLAIGALRLIKELVYRVVS